MLTVRSTAALEYLPGASLMLTILVQLPWFTDVLYSSVTLYILVAC